MATTGKAIDGARKQAGSPIDPPLRKQTQKAWTGGSNPLTQRSANMSVSNGVVNSSKPVSLSRPNGSQSLDSHTSDKHANDRLLFILSTCKGLLTEFTLKNGQQYSGVFSGASVESSETRYVFKMAKRIHSEQLTGSNGTADEYAGVGEDHVLSVDMADVADVSVKNVSLDKNQTKTRNGTTSTSFRTDVDISGNQSFKERSLKPWEPSNDIPSDMSLDDAGHSRPWDQFEANSRLYGLTSNYDEDIYTTKIDRSNPLYKQRAAEAERIAREIEASTAFNAHVAEERGITMPDDSGLDEEEKYSGVRRDFAPLPSSQPNKYTPPAKRAPTGQATVPGVPFDPAIISAQIAQPVQATAKTATTSSKSESAPTEKPKSPAPAATAAPVDESSKAEAVPSASTAQAEIPKTKAAPETKPTTSKPTPDTTQKSTIKQVTGLGVAAGKRNGKTDSATANVEHELLDQFKQFSANEKLRIQERQRNMARHDKAVKLNDLKSFSKTFKLHTPVPQDLVPILAKDEAKQKQIVEKALQNVNDHKTPPKATAAPPAPAVAEAKPNARPAPSNKYDQAHASPTVDRQAARRQNQNNYGPGGGRGDRQPTHHLPPIPNRGQATLLSQRLAIAQQHHKAGAGTMHPGFPPPIPMPAAGASTSSSGGQTPTSSVSGRFNAGATPFVPNPAANSFRPGGNVSAGSSPRVETPIRQEPRPIKITSFFGAQKPAVSDGSGLANGFNVVKRIKKDMRDLNKVDEFVNNGGIPQAYRTGPTWDVPPHNRDMNHKDMFDRMIPAAQPISAPQASLGGVPIPHQHQLPPHLQQQMPPAAQNHTPHHTPRHPPVQPHHGPGSHPYESGGHPMQFSASASSVHPSPRPTQQYIYAAQGPQGMPPTAMYQQPVPGYGMSPGIQHVHLRQPGPAQFGQMPTMGGHMMTNQPSGAPPYMVPVAPQMQVYSPTPGQVYPHHTGIPPPPGGSGYPSPRPPGAQIMQHQGSQQGHPPGTLMYIPSGQPPMYAQMPGGPMSTPGRHYPQPHPVHYGSPHQGNMFPQQNHRGTPSATYSQPMMSSHSMGGHPQQMVPPPNGPAPHIPNGEEAK